MRKPFTTKAKTAEAAPAASPKDAPTPNKLAQLFGLAKTAREQEPQNDYKTFIMRLVDGTALNAEELAEFEAAASKLAATPADVEADIAGWRSLVKMRAKIAAFDVAATDAELTANGTLQRHLKEELRKTEVRFNILSLDLRLHAMRVSGSREAELKLWRLLGGTPGHGAAALENEWRRDYEAGRSVIDQGRWGGPQPRTVVGPGGYGLVARS